MELAFVKVTYGVNGLCACLAESQRYLSDQSFLSLGWKGHHCAGSQPIYK